jgi:hypothetical protein
MSTIGPKATTRFDRHAAGLIACWLAGMLATVAWCLGAAQQESIRRARHVPWDFALPIGGVASLVGAAWAWYWLRNIPRGLPQLLVMAPLLAGVFGILGGYGSLLIVIPGLLVLPIGIAARRRPAK